MDHDAKSLMGGLEELAELMDDEGKELRDKEMMSLIEHLREQHFTIPRFVLAVPVMLEGTLPTGEIFTFRCRNQKCALTVAGETVKRTTKLDGTPFEQWDAGHLAPHEAAEMLAHLLREAGYAEAERRVRAATT